MKRRRQLWTGILAGIVMLLLILDPKTAIYGAKEGVLLCLYTVIPSLFPFFIISSLLTNSFLGRKIPFLQPICKLCGIPEGAESLLVLSFLGGYPVGAQAVTDAYTQGQLKKTTAHRLLGFCNNAGPAFLFGMIGPMFVSKRAPWALWLIHMLTALITGMILPGKCNDICALHDSESMTVSQALERSIRIMASVCGWVVIFRVVLAVLDRWAFWLFAPEWQVILSGSLELSNGCLGLQSVQSEGLRFVISSCMLALGGLCVGMQTVSATGRLGTGLYFPGKLFQSLLSFLLAGITQYFLFPHSECLAIPLTLYICVIAAASITYFYFVQKSSSNMRLNAV